MTPITRAPSSRRQAVASVCSALSGSSAVSTAPPPGAESALACSADQHSPRPGLERSRREPAAVLALTPETDEQGSGARIARVDRDALWPVAVVWRGDQPGAGRGGDLLGCPAPHRRLAPDACSAPSALAGHRHVVERDLAPGLELLALLVALAGDHDHVAGSAPAIARAIAARRSTSCSTPGGGRRGSRRRSRRDPRSGGCPRSRSPGRRAVRRSRPSAAACRGRGHHRSRTRRSAAPAVRPRAALSTFSSESGVCA